MGAGTEITIKRNFIGVDPSGTARPNAGPGILFCHCGLDFYEGATRVTIGGSTSASENRIAHNAGPAIDVTDTRSKGVGDRA